MESGRRHKMTINIDNIIFEYEVQSDFNSEFEKYLKAYEKVVLKDIFKEYNIQKINRFGCIFKCQLDEGNDIFNDVQKIIHDKTRQVESISFRYNKTTKKPTEIEGEVRSDFENEIITYDKPTFDKKINFFVDYQRYFNQPYKYIQDSKPTFEDFVHHSYESFKENYINHGEKK